MRKYLRDAAAILFMATASMPVMGITLGYTQANLVADTSGLGAATVDPSLVNPWGMSFSATSPFWISNAGSNGSTAYNGAGVATTINVTVTGGPTGQVNNSAGAGTFEVGGAASNFIFDTLSGTISAWNGSLGLTGTAMTMVSTSGVVYTGLAQAKSGVSTFLYAANFTSGGGINVYDSNFNQVNSTTFAGKFVESNLPSGYAPFNIQLVGNNLYVEYALTGPTAGNPTRGAGERICCCL
jgi:uncharacterized protein (TIGR03118 family)